MISLYSGTPGSGKSLHAASIVKAWLRMGRPVIANYEINLDLVRHPELFLFMPNDHLSPANLEDVANQYWTKTGKQVAEGSLLLIMDEAQLLFNARQWQKTDAKGWCSFFTQHRKYGYDVILIAQFDRMLDRQIRSLIEYEYIHRKVSNFGAYGKIMSALFMGKLFVAVQIWYPLKERISADWFIARPGLYRLYDTFRLLDKETPEPVG